MSNKKIYRGLNKRRRFDFRKYITIILCIALVGGYTYKKIKSSEIFKDINLLENIGVLVEKIYFWRDIDGNLEKNDNLSENSMKTLSNKQTSSKKRENLESNEVDSDDTEVAIVKARDVYLIQVGSFENQADLNSVQNKLNQKGIPNAVIQIDGVNKAQAYVSFEAESLRNQLSSVKVWFLDAFIAKLEIPALSLEYTADYSYVNNIAVYLNDLLDNYREESAYYSKNTGNFDYNAYKETLSKRSVILDNLNEELKKIDYSKLNLFKSSLLSYTSQVKENVNTALQSINEKDFYKSESLLILSIHKYYEFINTIKMS